MYKLAMGETIMNNVVNNYNENLWNAIDQAVVKYDMIQAEDHIAVNITEDKGTILLIQSLKELQKKIEFEIVFFITRELAERDETTDLLELLDVEECQVLMTEQIEEIFEIIPFVGCNKVAINQNNNDIVHATFNELIYNKRHITIQPVQESKVIEGMSFIRPLCLVNEVEFTSALEKQEMDIRQARCLFNQMAGAEDGMYYPVMNGNHVFEVAVYN